MSLPVLPSQKGKLPSEPEQDRLIGMELEFHPGANTAFDWRILLYQAGVDTIDDGCQTRIEATRRTDAAGQSIPDPQRYRSRSCSCATTNQRALHIARCSTFSVSDMNLLTRLAGTTVPNPRLNSWNEACSTAVHRAFPRLEGINRTNWNLGTDPTAGLELRSPPLTVAEDPFAAYEAITKCLDEHGAEANHACGTHIHVDMRDKDIAKRARLAGTYLMCEALILAAVAPNRYYNGYNLPLALANREPQYARIPAETGHNHGMASFSGHNHLLNFSSLTEHGTVEWRQLEGTFDAKTLKHWALLALRFTEASQNKWGVKLARAVPFKVTPQSIKDFMYFLDLNRKDLSDDLKETRDWYFDRVRTMNKRSAFERTLVTSPNLADLRKLKADGTDATFGRVAFIPEPTATRSPTEVGQQFLRFIERTIALGGLRRAEDPEPTSYLVNGGTEQEYIRANAVVYLSREGVTEDIWNRFANAIVEHDAERCGTFVQTHILNQPNPQQSLSRLNSALSHWMAYWSVNQVGGVTMSNMFDRSSGGVMCVDF